MSNHESPEDNVVPDPKEKDQDAAEVSYGERITGALVKNVQPIALACEAKAVFVYADAVRPDSLRMPPEIADRVVFISRTADAAEGTDSRFIRIPNVNLTRLGQVKVAVFLALSKGVVHRGDVIVCLTGLPSSGALDTLIITEVGREPEIFASSQGEEQLPAGIEPQVVERVIEIAAELGSEGREGKPVGALFVIGDSERVLSLAKQLILNPFHGYPEEQRNVLDPGLEETIKELSSIDGAFIIRGDGVIVTCGAYLKTSLRAEEEYALPHGLGARHHAAAGITAVTDSIAVVVSESTGTVTVFRNGHIVVEIEKLRTQVRQEI